jgi:curved DNA-binding protein CbpA
MNTEKAYTILGVNNNVTVQQAAKAYKKNIFKCHPDHGGTNEAFIDLQKAYELVMANLTYTGKQYNKATSEVEDIEKNYTQELINKIMELIETFSTNDEININIIGNWIWLDGETKPHKEAIKSLGFKFSKNKTAWYWHEGGYRRFGGRSDYSMDEIAYRHGGMFQVSKKRKTKLQTLQPMAV